LSDGLHHGPMLQPSLAGFQSWPNYEQQAPMLLTTYQYWKPNREDKDTHLQWPHPDRSSCPFGIGHRPWLPGHSMHPRVSQNVDKSGHTPPTCHRERGSVAINQDRQGYSHRQKSANCDVWQVSQPTHPCPGHAQAHPTAAPWGQPVMVMEGPHWIP